MEGNMWMYRIQCSPHLALARREQKTMATATKRLTKGTIAHGNAGQASVFLALADKKLKKGGMLALVMPLVFLTGASWEKARSLLANNYNNLILISIAGSDIKSLSFSADTGLGECLAIGQQSEQKHTRATFVILSEKPDYSIQGIAVAYQIRQLIKKKELRQLEDGPVGGSIIQFGNEIIGQAIDAPLPSSGGWKLARIADLSLAQTAYHLSDKTPNLAADTAHSIKYSNHSGQTDWKNWSNPSRHQWKKS